MWLLFIWDLSIKMKKLHEISICWANSLSCFQESKEANLSEESLTSQGNNKILQIHRHSPLTEETTGKPFSPAILSVCVRVEILGVKTILWKSKTIDIIVPNFG